MLVLALSPYVVGGLVVLFLAVSVILILTVLIQRPTGGGLSGAFGSGAGSGQTAFGAKTGDVLTMVTIVVFGVWLLGAIGLNFATRPPEAPVDNAIEATGSPEGSAAAAGENGGEGAEEITDPGEGDIGEGDGADGDTTDGGTPDDPQEGGG